MRVSPTGVLRAPEREGSGNPEPSSLGFPGGGTARRCWCCRGRHCQASPDRGAPCFWRPPRPPGRQAGKTVGHPPSLCQHPSPPTIFCLLVCLFASHPRACQGHRLQQSIPDCYKEEPENEDAVGTATRRGESIHSPAQPPSAVSVKHEGRPADTSPWHSLVPGHITALHPLSPPSTAQGTGS